MSESEYPKAFKEAYQMNAQGSISEAYYEICQHQDATDMNDQPLGWQGICKRYKQYIKFCDSQNTEPKYRKHMANWIREKQYLNDYKVKGTKRSRVIQSWLKGLIKLFASW